MLDSPYDRMWADLSRWGERDGPLDAYRSPSATVNDRACFRGGQPTAARRDVHAEIVEDYAALNKDVPRDGWAVLFTAGPPGAGKSTAVAQAAAAFGATAGGAFAHVDPDEVKARLIATLSGPGHAMPVPPSLRAMWDEGRLAPMELSGLVHVESVEITNRIISSLQSGGVNLVVDGTWSWQPHAERQVTQLRDAGYGVVDALCVDVPVEVAVDRAQQRWVRGRQAWERGENSELGRLGGRSVPESLIRSQYDGSVDVDGHVHARSLQVVRQLRPHLDHAVVMDGTQAGVRLDLDSLRPVPTAHQPQPAGPAGAQDPAAAPRPSETATADRDARSAAAVRQIFAPIKNPPPPTAGRQPGVPGTPPDRHRDPGHER